MKRALPVVAVLAVILVACSLSWSRAQTHVSVAPPVMQTVVEPVSQPEPQPVVSVTVTSEHCRKVFDFLAKFYRTFPEVGDAVEKKADEVHPGSGKYVRWTLDQVLDAEEDAL